MNPSRKQHAPLLCLITLFVLSWIALPVTLAGSPETAVLKVEGMTCGSCAAGIEAMVSKLSGVEEASVDFSAGQAVIRFDPDAIALDALRDSIKQIGYETTVLPASAAVAGETGEAAACGTEEGAQIASASSADGLSDAELALVVDYVMRLIDEKGAEAFGAISAVVIEEETGVEIPDSAGGQIERAIIAAMQERHPALLAQVRAGSRCSDYGACSLDSDLSGATGEILVMYEREKGEDGRLYDNTPLPAFEARDLEGNPVHSSDLRGRPTVLTLLAGHCSHSHDSLPILEETLDRWGAEGLRVVAVLVNSGSPENVSAWISRLEPRYEVWVYDDTSLGDLLGAHLVPSYLFVNAAGQITEKLVGYKEKAIVQERVSALMDTRDSLDLQKIGAATGAP